MRVPNDHPLATTFQVHDDSCPLELFAKLGERDDQYALDCLVETVVRAPNAQMTVAALRALKGKSNTVVQETIRHALSYKWRSVLLAAMDVLDEHSLKETSCIERLEVLLTTDDSRLVRRDAMRLLSRVDGDRRWSILRAADDPHWRTRKELIQILLSWSSDPHIHEAVEKKLAEQSPNVRVDGVLRYLQYRWSDREKIPNSLPPIDEPVHHLDLWDWDPAVLAYQMEQLDDDKNKSLIDFMPALFWEDDERVSRRAGAILNRFASDEHLIELLSGLGEPRKIAANRIEKWMASQELDRRESVSRKVLRQPGPPPHVLAWAIDQADEAYPADDESEVLLAICSKAQDVELPVRQSIARLRIRWKRFETGNEENRNSDQSGFLVRKQLAERLVRSKEKPDELRELQRDPHPIVRAAAVTDDRAAQLMSAPTLDTSWHVLSRAAQLSKTPIWHIEPERVTEGGWGRVIEPPESTTVGSKTRPQPPIFAPRVLGQTRVSPMGLSGHYYLPVDGFYRGIEAGINLLFWEPFYETLTEFSRKLSPAEKDPLHFLVGTFEAKPKKIRADVDRALRTLQIDQIRFFILFWVRSWKRVTPEVRECLESLKREGKIGTFGLSSHSRPLLVEAIHEGWNPIMARHSAAHPGAEESVFPAAVEKGLGLITFNNTCYGRLLERIADDVPAMTAADCYRYSLSQPGVSVCFTAPANLEQLEENLTVLQSPNLTDERLAEIKKHGNRVYQEERIFTNLVKDQ